MLGRTMPYAYRAQRSTESRTLGRQLLSTAIDVRQAKRAARYWRQRFGLLVVIAAVIIGAANVLMLDSQPVVLPATSSHIAFLHPWGVYQRAAEQLLGGSVLNRNKITVDTSAVTAGLKRQFPELSVVSMTLPLFGHKPMLYVAQADPALLLIEADGRQYIVDTEGRAVADGASVLASISLLSVRDQSGADVRLGTLAVPSSTVAFIKALHFQLAQRQVRVDYFVLPAASSELDVYLTGQRYFIKCNLVTGTALQQAGTFLATQQYFEGRGIVPEKYVDVRVDGRAYYK